MVQGIGVAQYYAGKSVFITGATGFMGLVLVEKILRSCPDLKTLYLLMRSRKGLSIEERFLRYVNCEVFDRIQAECPKSLHKIRLVPGDMVADQLGISPLDREELQREVQIIFHCAASVRFDMFLRDAVNINVCGTLKLLELAETMKNLEVFLHVSTAYCHDDLDVLDEQMYPGRHSPEAILNLTRWMDDEILRRIEKKLIHPLPNSYAYTKALSEDLVAQYAGKFTIAVARPSIVMAAHQGPIPGWINNFNGPTGLMVAAAKGVFHIMHTYEDVTPDVIPVDLAVNATIILAATTGLERPKEIRVCNITNSGANSISWVDTSRRFNETIKKYPFFPCLWYPSIGYYETRLLFQLHALFAHWLPALFIDTLLILFRKKPLLIKTQKRLHHGLNLLHHYMTGNWTFKNDYFISLRDRLKKDEKEIFYTECEDIDVREYSENYLQGARLYCCKEPPSTIPKAKRLFTFLYYLQLTFRIIFLWWFLSFLYVIMVKIFSTKAAEVTI